MTPAEQIAADMRALPKEARKVGRRKLREAASSIQAAAQSRASWSSRIPATVRITTSFRVGREGVAVHAGNASTPHARPYEGAGGKGTFRHPVHGTRVWVTQATRPYLLPSGRAATPQVTQNMIAGLSEAAAAIGFTGG